MASVLLIASAAGAGGILLYRHNAARQKAQAKPQQPAAVFQGDEVSLEGTIQARNIVQVEAPIEGKIQEFHTASGEEVYEGQLLVKIRSESLEGQFEAATAAAERAQSRLNTLESSLIAARLEDSRARADATRARGELERADKIYQRQKLLVAEGATPRLVFEKAEKEYLAAKAEFEATDTLARQAEERTESLRKDLETARQALDERNRELEEARADAAAGEVRSPVDGIVVARYGEVGTDVNRSIKDLFRIATDLGALEVTAEPPPPVLARIERGQRALVTVAENPDPLAGTVKAIEAGRVIISFRNPNPLVKPGLSAQVRIRF